MAAHRRRHARLSLRSYALIALACAGAALLIQYLATVPDKVEEYAEQTVDQAVRKAIRAEAEERINRH